MLRIGIVLLTVASFTLADELKDAISLLKRKDDQSLLRGAELARRMGSGAKRAAPQLVKNLAHETWGIRSRMKRALLAIGSGATPALLKGMRKSKNVTQRREIAEVLYGFGPDTAKYNKELVGLLDDPDEEVRRKIGDALGERGEATIPLLMQALGSASANQRSGAAWALGKQGAAVYQPALGALNHKRALVRAGAATVLGNMGTKAAPGVSKVIPLVHDSDADVRLAAVRALGSIKARGSDAVPALILAFADSDPRIATAAVKSAAQFGADAAPALVKALSGPSSASAGRALNRIGRPAVSALETELETKNAAARRRALDTLAGMGPFVRIDLGAMQERLHDGDASVRAAAADALALCGPTTSAMDLREMAGDPDPSVRAAVVRALGYADATEPVLAGVKKMAADKDAAVQLAAASALWHLGQPTKVTELARAALAGDDARVRDAACDAVRPMGRAAESLIPDLIAATEKGASVPLVDALGAIAAAHGNGILGRAKRYKRAPGATRKSIDSALDWLRRFQDTRASGVNKADGRWHPKQFVAHDKLGTVKGTGLPNYSPGVTGLALCTFMAVGLADDPSAREGLEYLLRAQRRDGLFREASSQHFLIDHAFATAAVCEAWILTGDPRYRRAARRAVAACVASRNPDLGWRYEPRGNENDTNVTVAMLHALALAERGGIEVDPDAFAGGGRLLIAMTGDFQIGYNVKDGSCARPEGLQERFPPEKSGSMTAAGLWAFSLVERHGVRPPNLKPCLEICRDLMPLWQDGRIDMFYWHYGTLAFFARQGKDWKQWNTKLAKALIPNQNKKLKVLEGSWDPDGPWGADAGRVYSTAINALSLATPFRFSKDFVEGKPTGAYADAAKTLAKLAKSGKGAVRARAAFWLRSAGR